jgi:MarR family transcriptional regulator, organic hydroperoxide resistance regulator
MNDRSIDRWGRTSAGFLARLAIRFVPTRTVLAMAKAKRTVHRLKSPSPRRPSQAFSAQHSIGTALRETYRSFARSLAPRLQEHGVTLAMWFALRELWIKDGLSQSEIARNIDSRASAVVGLVDALRRARLVRLERSATDRRVSIVRLTRAGRAIRSRLVPHGSEVNTNALDGFSQKEVRALFAMLTRLRENLAR